MNAWGISGSVLGVIAVATFVVGDLELDCSADGGKWYNATRTCFRADIQEASYNDSIAICKSMGGLRSRGRLAVIRDVPHWNWLKANLPLTSADHWIGMRAFVPGSLSVDDWRWYDEESSVIGLLNPDIISEIVVNIDTPGQECFRIDQTLKWADSFCVRKKRQLCEIYGVLPKPAEAIMKTCEDVGGHTVCTYYFPI